MLTRQFFFLDIVRMLLVLSMGVWAPAHLLAGDKPSLANPCAEAPISLIFQDESTYQVPELFASQVQTSEASGAALVDVSSGAVDIFVGIVGQRSPEEGRLQGWSLSIAVSGMDIIAATTRGTAMDPEPPGVFCGGGFDRTEVVDPTIIDPATGKPQGPGVVNTIVFFCAGFYPLETSGTSTVLRLSVSGDEGDSGRVEWRDGLTGSGRPVGNVVTAQGETREFDCSYPAIVSFVEPRFVRCDTNGDGNVDISDAILMLGSLFFDRPEPECRRSADCNDDEVIDISDPISTLNFLFLTGTKPVAPFPFCGTDVQSALDCETAPGDCN